MDHSNNFACFGDAGNSAQSLQESWAGIYHKAASLGHSNDSELSVPEIYLNLCFVKTVKIGG